ncbi:hypothetical protein HHK36_012751 [Tetracentron sinense]|uniref:Uncharacterized protein n=1 Tax=Tetracentron sinense TaxID=13715 RepID=A0A834Z996_TETSI|nr:hypothetical protein HHK36_012751 [Tetracentron sinense]
MTKDRTNLGSPSPSSSGSIGITMLLDQIMKKVVAAIVFFILHVEESHEISPVGAVSEGFWKPNQNNRPSFSSNSQPLMHLSSLDDHLVNQEVKEEQISSKFLEKSGD